VLQKIPAGQKRLGMLIAIIAVVAATRPWQLGVAVPTGRRRLRASPHPPPGLPGNNSGRSGGSSCSSASSN